MPRRVDQQARRRQIVEAVWRVMMDRGLESVSLRQVAAEAGGSVGLVQHYFKDKDEMLQFALEMLTENVDGRMARGIAALAEPEDPKALVRALLIELLPLDRERAVEARVASTFLARAAVDPHVAAHVQGRYAGGHEFLVRQLRRGGVKHPTEEANMLFALVDGLALHALAGRLLPETTLDALDAELDRLLDIDAPRRSRVDSTGRPAGARATALVARERTLRTA
ncbi:MAG TPA: TetR/AcrR family transcriptional regulator [Candidatus Dormibacteraeota bacterium]|jgi:AcrR family transcriptional regulator